MPSTTIDPSASASASPPDDAVPPSAAPPLEWEGLMSTHVTVPDTLEGPPLVEKLAEMRHSSRATPTPPPALTVPALAAAAAFVKEAGMRPQLTSDLLSHAPLIMPPAEVPIGNPSEPAMYPRMTPSIAPPVTPWDGLTCVPRASGSVSLNTIWRGHSRWSGSE